MIRRSMCILSLVAFLGTVFAESAFGDQATHPAPPPPPFQLDKATVEITAVVGTTLPMTLFRAHKDRRLTMGTLQVGRIMTRRRGQGPLAGNFELLLEVAPAIVLRQPQHTFGVAVSPLHMRWNISPSTPRPVGAFAEASGGILLTSEAVPLRTTRFNFIDQAGFGLRVGRHPRRAWVVGYRFQHISNGGRVKPNPGANFNFVYAGLT